MTHTTDRELLELAAKAAGLPYIKPLPEYDGSLGLEVGSDNPMRCRTWNPLAHDDDALRLGAALRLHILHNDPDDSVLWVSAVLNKRGFHGVVEFQDEVQRTGATRRAVVLAAAEIGKAGGAV